MNITLRKSLSFQSVIDRIPLFFQWLPIAENTNPFRVDSFWHRTVKKKSSRGKQMIYIKFTSTLLLPWSCAVRPLEQSQNAEINLSASSCLSLSTSNFAMLCPSLQNFFLALSSRDSVFFLI